MLEYNRNVKKKLNMLSRAILLLLPAFCIILLLSQTAFAKSTYLINDGGKVTIHSSYATDPEAILTEAGLTLGEDDTYTTVPGQMMQEITIQRKQIVTILQGDKKLEVTSYGETVESLINRLGLILTKADILSVPIDTMTSDGLVITVSRSHQMEQTYSVTVPFETIYCYDASLAEGEQVILTEGVNGQLLCTDTVSYVDGAEVSRVSVSQNVVRQKVDQVIAIGTYTEDPEQSPMPRPENTGKPIIGDGTIVTPDGEVLTFTSSLQVSATAYHNSDPGCTIYTAIGTLCRVGAIAVDPKVIPLGTRMYIVSNDGRYIYGIAVAEDTGKSIKGNKIDLYFDSVEECNIFGIRPCTVYFLG
jgi:3D (Asp-Asp-Asp) domain-containing protein